VYEISANIEGGFDDPDVVCAFDPTKVVVRLRLAFPGADMDPKDYAWRDYDGFLRMGHADEAGILGVAARDARRRGPLWLFRVPAPGGGWVKGSAERHMVRFHDQAPIPEPLRSRLLGFVEGLRFAPCVTMKCVRTEGNDEYTV
jgi:hypothetical protein